MFSLPSDSQALIGSQPIPGELIKLPPIPLLQILVSITKDHRSVVQHLSMPSGWKEFRGLVAERTESLKILEFSNRLYENDEYPMRAIHNLSIVSRFRRSATLLAEELGYPGLEAQRIEDADPEGLRLFCAALMDALWEWCKEIDASEDSDVLAKRYERYWKVVHPRRRLEARQRAERDCQIFVGILFHFFCNAVGTMAYGESVSSMVQRALAGGVHSDEAMCRALRVDNRLRHHPVFLDRYQKASREGDVTFLRKFNDVSTPFTDKIRFPGLYFMLALADGLGLLAQLSNAQLLELSDHAELHRYENRIEDAGYMGKRRNEYLKRKFQRMSMH